jgi:GNAT superfamily N-acetyltransferase
MSFSFRLREGRVEDIPVISRAYARSWQSTYRGIAPDAFVEGMTEKAAAQIFEQSLKPNSFSYFLYVAEADGEIVGFADGGKERGRPGDGQGELYAIYLLKEFQGNGIGRQLFQAAFGQLRRSGLSPVVVWVLEKNPYRKFYESLGGVLGPERKVLKVGEDSVALLCYRWAVSSK